MLSTWLWTMREVSTGNRAPQPPHGLKPNGWKPVEPSLMPGDTNHWKRPAAIFPWIEEVLPPNQRWKMSHTVCGEFLLCLSWMNSFREPGVLFIESFMRAKKQNILFKKTKKPNKLLQQMDFLRDFLRDFNNMVAHNQPKCQHFECNYIWVPAMCQCECLVIWFFFFLRQKR